MNKEVCIGITFMLYILIAMAAYAQAFWLMLGITAVFIAFMLYVEFFNTKI